MKKPQGHMGNLETKSYCWLIKIHIDSSTWEKKLRCGMRFSDFTSRRHLNALDFCPGTWRRKRGGDLEAEWGSAAPSVPTRLGVSTCMRR
uniref:Uncharacterized protein n=1 Tax=Magallana gigas TaxID=29159 RepID=A0A8W8MGR0_MAGGI